MLYHFVKRELYSIISIRVRLPQALSIQGKSPEGRGSCGGVEWVWEGLVDVVHPPERLFFNVIYAVTESNNC